MSALKLYFVRRSRSNVPVWLSKSSTAFFQAQLSLHNFV